MPERLAEIRSIGQSALTSATTEGPRAVLRFQPTAEIRERLEAIVVAESTCCAFLAFDLAYDSHELALTIEAPTGAEPVMTELVDAFRGETQAAA
jgi:hypothetical protein